MSSCRLAHPMKQSLLGLHFWTQEILPNYQMRNRQGKGGSVSYSHGQIMKGSSSLVNEAGRKLAAKDSGGFVAKFSHHPCTNTSISSSSSLALSHRLDTIIPATNNNTTKASLDK